MALSLLLLAAASVPPAPVVASTPVTARPLVAWLPGEVRCGGVPVVATTMRRPLTTLGWSQTIDTVAPVTMRFRIDADGRPLSIARVVTDPVAYASFSQDIAPSLAASRFAAGAARSGCEITYRLRVTPLAQAPAEDLISYTISPDAGRLPREGWDRIKPAMGDCLDVPRPEPLVRVLPDFRTLPATPGVRDWTMVAYDSDKAGRPVRTRTLYGTGNRALDAAGLKAMRASRFTGGARRGCLYPYWLKPKPLAAPISPEPDSLRPADSVCPARSDWSTRPPLVYPDNFRRRSIEGWAVVAFDVAPWGETGNIRVLASEPAEDFGRQATQLIRQARKPASATGQTGCIERIRFVMGGERQVADGVTVPPMY